jgi:hypothetical protein
MGFKGWLYSDARNASTVYTVLVRATHTAPKVPCAILKLDQLLGVQLRGCSPHPDPTGYCENSLALGYAF